jgi:hypothetical protein
MHDPYQPQVCDDCLSESREIEEYMEETGDWKGTMKRVKAMEAKFLFANVERMGGERRETQTEETDENET